MELTTFAGKTSGGEPAEFFSGPPGYAPGAPVRKVGYEGLGASGIMLIGEAPGEWEEREGLPFRPWAEAGSVLERALFRAGIPRASLIITNIVWYRPPRNWLEGAPWEEEAIRACRPMLARLIGNARPKVIVALGGLAMRELTGLAGEKAGIGMVRGFIVPAWEYPAADGRGVPVVGTYHPSFLRRGSKERQTAGPKGKTEAAGGGTQGMSLLGVVIRDLLLAREVAQTGAPKFVYDDYKMGATTLDWQNAYAFLQAWPTLPISYDFETVDTLLAPDESEMEVVRRDVTQVQISWRIGQAVVSRWSGELLPMLKAIIELPNPKIDWNGRKFDRPLLRDMQIRTDIGEWHDGMDLWHHSQPDLPRGLQYAASFACPEAGPWKHLSATDPLWYGAMDVDMPQRIFEKLRGSLGSIRHPVSGVSLWDGYGDQVVRLAPVLDRMSARGIPVDDGKRLELDTEFTVVLERTSAACQALVPEELRNVTPKNGYVRPPEEVMRECWECAGKKKVRLPGAKKMTLCEGCGGAGKTELEAVPPGFVQRVFVDEVKCGCLWAKAGRKLKASVELVDAVLAAPDCPECGNTGKVTSSVVRWCVIQPFLPGSWQQVLRYMEWAKKHDIQARLAKYLQKRGASLPTTGLSMEEHARIVQGSSWKIPVDHKTGKPTTAADELVRLGKRTDDPLLPLIVEYKEVEKMRGTYVRGWAPGGDGKVHTHFMFKPATGQLSAESPNSMNFPAHGALAKKMKEMLVSAAEDGRTEC
jgi:uracil-DNA glycosylase family 4